MIELLADYCRRRLVPGVAVATFDSCGVTAAACHGVSDVETRAPVREDTRFRIYSLAKLLTACAVTGLVRQGLLDLDADVTRYVPDLKNGRRGDGQSLTLRQALSHRSGLVPDALTWARLSRNDEDLEREVRADYARAFGFAAPGRHYGYSNASFNLSALVMEQVTGATFTQAMHTLLLERLHLDGTTHDPALVMTYPTAQPHELVDGEARVIHRPLVGAKWLAGSQCYSTLPDMAAFGSWLLRDLRAATAQARVDEPLADLRLDIGTRYGLGCYLVRSEDGTPTVGHEGFFDGMWVKLVVDPQRDRGLIWMDNRGDELRDERYAVMRALVPGLLPSPDRPPSPTSHQDGSPPHDPAFDPAPAVGMFQRVGAPDLRLDRQDDDVVVTVQGLRRVLSRFGPGLWCGPAATDDSGPWRPHAGSTQVCLGVAAPDPDGIRVVHLNAIPYAGRPVVR